MFPSRIQTQHLLLTEGSVRAEHDPLEEMYFCLQRNYMFVNYGEDVIIRHTVSGAQNRQFVSSDVHECFLSWDRKCHQIQTCYLQK